MAGTGNAASPRTDPWKWLASKKWAGLAVIVSAAGVVLGLVFSQGGTTTNNQNGSTCAAQGGGNSVNCTAPGARPSP